MEQWIPYEEGDYTVEAAFFCAPAGRGVEASDLVVSVYTDAHGERQLSGHGRVENARLMALLDDDNRIDLVLDFTEGHRYRLVDPVVRAGKVFAPGVRSSFHFQPQSPWLPLSDPRFAALVAETAFR